MASTPTPRWGYTDELRGLTPVANQAAMRGYTRNAPYMAGLVGDPQAMQEEIFSLYNSLEKNPNDPVSEYRLRILKQAIQDIYNMQAPQSAFEAVSYPESQTQTPHDFSKYEGRATTPRPIAENMAKRGR
jgi:hypothetical protein